MRENSSVALFVSSLEETASKLIMVPTRDVTYTYLRPAVQVYRTKPSLSGDPLSLNSTCLQALERKDTLEKLEQRREGLFGRHTADYGAVSPLRPSG